MNVVKIEDIELDLTKLNRKTCELPEKVLKYLNDYLLPDESIERPLRVDGVWKRLSHNSKSKHSFSQNI